MQKRRMNPYLISNQINTEPNQALQPTTMPVTFRADARTAPGMVAAEL